MPKRKQATLQARLQRHTTIQAIQHKRVCNIKQQFKQYNTGTPTARHNNTSNTADWCHKTQDLFIARVCPQPQRDVTHSRHINLTIGEPEMCSLGMTAPAFWYLSATSNWTLLSNKHQGLQAYVGASVLTCVTR